MKDYKTELIVNLGRARELALGSIKQAQARQREFYDRQSYTSTYRVGDCVMVFMPTDTTGRDRKFARPYHGPFHVVSLIPTNAEVQLIEQPKDQSLFVAISRLCKCYPDV